MDNKTVRSGCYTWKTVQSDLADKTWKKIQSDLAAIHGKKYSQIWLQDMNNNTV